jgi:hypothetical protein
MKQWLKKFPWKQMLLTSVCYMLISFVIHEIEAFITLRYYLMPQYFGLWSKVMMPTAGPPPASFMFTSLLFGFLSGFAYSYIYVLLKVSFPKGYWHHVFSFADVLVGIFVVTFLLPTYLMFNVPMGLLIYWFISSFVISVLSAMVFVKLVK